ncbi:N-acetylglucosamine-6-phosphate deacetylase [Aerococcus sanguinicola]|uniref:N-acetylglucosamine-6-phosphate deacetylase n=1 Tax=unclassified Aerococcus TaxID=2618060 RepID=UPI0008A25A4B|nr:MULTISPECIES: N-acetylglucosamine-6-phosphate deacetylase [unclassified Aerococcus]KAB0647364.1 N-acetylglucosamine-6-phosphate deacetylase [Aerococcus sanguinicola]MDK6856009.1 N-acetylglucosamine-6-phosphate deacetylase [Aerococcus sp. UMB7533]MDK8502396.1 N-acetylglucosamine-6-phosphate deacetylase [Aerococcus sp. UMB1112A]OFN00311.1 N-acetylglucosamine-6-phosphate deacetylase [Aerococcus sp. HMSC062A02]OHO45038.1 N-acetylglucosamine-6-phosphate deacetylase [Aerococcus sp. HMSC035B07]
MRQAIKADRFFLENEILGPGYLILEDGKFLTYSSEELEEVEDVLDYSGYWVGPGLVDTHIHGFNGSDVMDATPEAVETIRQGLPATGVTSFLATTLTASVEETDRACAVVAEVAEEDQGAKIQGIFLEGPFFVEAHKGAQNPDYFIAPSPDVLDQWQKSAKDLIRKAALAPEYPETAAFIERAKALDVKVAIGHTDASYDQARRAVDQGASLFVHTFNGMSGLHHREPGVVGAAMTLQNTYAEVIADGHHVTPAAIKALLNARNVNNTLLVTDCMRAGGLEDGNYTLGEYPVEVKEGAARLSNGSLAGSVLQLKDAVRNLVDWELTTVHEALNMASAVAARSVGIDDRCGSIKAGRAADFIVMTPQLELQATYINGQVAYQK